MENNKQEKELQLINLIDEAIEVTKLQEDIYYSFILKSLNKLKKSYLNTEESRKICVTLARSLENPMIDKEIESKVFAATDYYVENFID